MKKWHFKFSLLPLIFFTAIVILLLKATTAVSEIDFGPNFSVEKGQTIYNIFTKVKSTAIFASAIWAAITLGYLLITEQIKIKKTLLYIPMVLYLVSVLLSLVLSDYKILAWMGDYERYEGTRTLFCYMFMLFYAIQIIDDVKDVIVVLVTTAVSTLINCLIGFSQLIGKDVLLSPLVSKIIAGDLKLQGEFKPGQVYQTVANMNYVGMYLALLVPFLVAVIIHGKKKYKILAAILLVLIALNIYGSKSLGGILGIGAGLILFLVFNLKKKWMQITILGTCFVGFILMMCLVYVKGTKSEYQTRQVDFFETKIDEVSTSIYGNELTIQYDRENNEFRALDEEGKELLLYPYDDEKGTYLIEDERFKDEIYIASLYYEGIPTLGVDFEDEQFVFLFYEDGVKYINPFGNEITLSKVESIGFKGHLLAGSGRGFIWSRTLPLIKDCLIYGHGCGTYMLYFPQDDYAGKYTIDSPLYMICDKPHCMYLEMIVCTGGLSLIAFLTLMGMFFIKVVKEGQNNTMVKVLASGIAGFLVAGIMNDSTVSVMPMFYGFFGMCCGLLIKSEPMKKKK